MGSLQQARWTLAQTAAARLSVQRHLRRSGHEEMKISLVTLLAVSCSACGKDISPQRFEDVDLVRPSVSNVWAGVLDVHTNVSRTVRGPTRSDERKETLLILSWFPTDDPWNRKSLWVSQDGIVRSQHGSFTKVRRMRQAQLQPTELASLRRRLAGLPASQSPVSRHEHILLRYELSGTSSFRIFSRKVPPDQLMAVARMLDFEIQKTGEPEQTDGETTSKTAPSAVSEASHP